MLLVNKPAFPKQRGRGAGQWSKITYGPGQDADECLRGHRVELRWLCWLSLPRAHRPIASRFEPAKQASSKISSTSIFSCRASLARRKQSRGAATCIPVRRPVIQTRGSLLPLSITVRVRTSTIIDYAAVNVTFYRIRLWSTYLHTFSTELLAARVQLFTSQRAGIA